MSENETADKMIDAGRKILKIVDGWEANGPCPLDDEIQSAIDAMCELALPSVFIPLAVANPIIWLVNGFDPNGESDYDGEGFENAISELREGIVHFDHRAQLVSALLDCTAAMRAAGFGPEHKCMQAARAALVF